jgi:hypothetical protein
MVVAVPAMLSLRATIGGVIHYSEAGQQIGSPPGP